MIRAYAAQTIGQPLQIFSYEPNALNEEEVEVVVSHCGICHSDVHLVDNDWKNSLYPLVPGHEIVGTVVAKGHRVTHLEIGQRVGIGWQCGSCLSCAWCVTGEEHLCDSPKKQPVANGHFGGFAEKVRSHARFVVPIPESLSSELAAPLLCAGVTVYSPLRQYQVTPNMKIAIIGIGGLGHLAIQFAKAFGCEVTAISSTADKEAEAQSFGAAHFLVSSDTQAMQKHKNQFDFMLSTVAANLPFGDFFQMLRPNGKLCLVAGPSEITIPSFMLFGRQASLCGSNIGSPHRITEMLEFAARHQISPKIQKLPMSQINEGFDWVRENKARYRVVLENDFTL